MREAIVEVILSRGTFAHGPEDRCVQCVTLAGDLADAITREIRGQIDLVVEAAVEASGLPDRSEAYGIPDPLVVPDDRTVADLEDQLTALQEVVDRGRTERHAAQVRAREWITGIEEISPHDAAPFPIEFVEVEEEGDGDDARWGWDCE